MYFLLSVVSTISIVVLVAGPKLMDFEDDFGEWPLTPPVHPPARGDPAAIDANDT